MNTELPFIRSRQRLYRLGMAWLCIVLAIVIWIPSGDVIDMIIRQKEIVFGRYSRGHFAALFLLSLILLGIAALCFSRIKTVGEMLLVAVMVSFSTIVSGFVLVVGSGLFTKPRYVEENVAAAGPQLAVAPVAGIVRHRPPHEFYQLEQTDVPEQRRSYPGSPKGYPTFSLTLTTDAYGYRNQTALDQYSMLAVGDSFVAGSHVSDEQAWVSLLGKKLNRDIYNLGVSGSDPGTYFNNYFLLGRKFKPQTVLFMIYEGNDFKDATPIVTEVKESAAKEKHTSLGEQIDLWAKASPVTKGLQRFSSEVLENIGKDCPVPGYEERVGFMPLRVKVEGREQVYGFEPKRLTYLYEEKSTFEKSRNWQRVADIMDRMVALGEQDGFKVVFLYAPSTPHVVMPLIRDAIPADQLRNFAAYQEDNLPDAETFKKNVFDWLDNEQQVFLDHCAAKGMSCLSLTDALQHATARGEQVYYSYDQHWTPDGNRVVADTLAAYFKNL